MKAEELRNKILDKLADFCNIEPVTNDLKECNQLIDKEIQKALDEAKVAGAEMENEDAKYRYKEENDDLMGIR